MDGHPDLAAGITSAELGANGVDLSAEVNALEVHLGPGHTRQLQQAIDQGGHARAACLDARGEVAAGFVEPVTVVLHQGLGEPAYPPQRGPQVVGDGIGEGRQVPIGPL